MQILKIISLDIIKKNKTPQKIHPIKSSPVKSDKAYSSLLLKLRFYDSSKRWTSVSKKCII